MRKNLLISALFFFVPLFLNAQIHNPRIQKPYNKSSHLPSLKLPEVGSRNSAFYKPIKITGDTLRITYTYNSSGNPLTQIEESLSNGIWVNTCRYTDTYDETGNRLTDIKENFSNGVWQNEYKLNYSYNSAGKLIEYIKEDWESGNWVNNYRIIYDYNTAGLISSETYQGWNNAWANSRRVSYTYNNSGFILTILEEINSYNNTWQNRWRSTKSYNNSNETILDIHEKWENNSWVKNFKYFLIKSGSVDTSIIQIGQNNLWVNDQRYVTIYDNQGKFIKNTFEQWINNSWIYSDRETYAYDNTGNVLSRIREKWLNNSWNNAARYTHSYDIFGNHLSMLSEEWSVNTWVNAFYLSYMYDGNKNCKHAEYKYWDEGNWVPCQGFIELTYNNGMDYLFMYSSEVDVEYTSLVNVFNEDALSLSFNLMQNYPNPFNPTTTINYTIANGNHVKLTVYDALGCQVSTLIDEYKPAGKYSVQFNGGNLTSGIYLYRLECGKFSESKKFLLIK